MTTLSILQLLLICIMVVLNCRSLYLFYSDKQRAIKKKYRIPEKKLLLSSALLGGVGAWGGMTLYRHKTKHPLFKVWVPVSAVLTLIALIAILLYL